MNNEIIVALRGTMPVSFIDWIDDDAEVFFDQYQYAPDGVNVHHGFYATFDEVNNLLFRILLNSYLFIYIIKNKL